MQPKIAPKISTSVDYTLKIPPWLWSRFMYSLLQALNKHSIAEWLERGASKKNAATNYRSGLYLKENVILQAKTLAHSIISSHRPLDAFDDASWDSHYASISTLPALSTVILLSQSHSPFRRLVVSTCSLARRWLLHVSWICYKRNNSTASTHTSHTVWQTFRLYQLNPSWYYSSIGVGTDGRWGQQTGCCVWCMHHNLCLRDARHVTSI